MISKSCLIFAMISESFFTPAMFSEGFYILKVNSIDGFCNTIVFFPRLDFQGLLFSHDKSWGPLYSPNVFPGAVILPL